MLVIGINLPAPQTPTHTSLTTKPILPTFPVCNVPIDGAQAQKTADVPAEMETDNCSWILLTKSAQILHIASMERLIQTICLLAIRDMFGVMLSFPTSVCLVILLTVDTFPLLRILGLLAVRQPTLQHVDFVV